MKEIIDLPDALERVQDDKELLKELFDIFTEDFIEKRQKIDPLMTGGQMEQIRDIIHSVKGAAGNISARAVHALCSEIERLSEANDAQAVLELIPQLDREFETLQAEIKKVKSQLDD